jgi:hypothetical protein
MLFGRPQSIQLQQISLLLYLLVELQNYNVQKAGKIMAQTWILVAST